MRTPLPLDRATDQLVDGAVETADLVADALVDVAHSAVDAVVDGGEALAALSLGRLTRRLRQPRSLLALLVLALVGVMLYRRFAGTDSEDSRDDSR